MIFIAIISIFYAIFTVSEQTGIIWVSQTLPLSPSANTIKLLSSKPLCYYSFQSYFTMSSHIVKLYHSNHISRISTKVLLGSFFKHFPKHFLASLTCITTYRGSSVYSRTPKLEIVLDKINNSSFLL